MIWFKNIFSYAGLKSLHIPIAITKLSDLNLFTYIYIYIYIYILCGRHRTIKCSSNQNVRSEHYDRLSCLPVKYVFAYLCAPCFYRHDTSSAHSSENERRYYCNIMRFVIWQCCIQSSTNAVLSLCRRLVSALPECVHVFWRRRGFAKWLCMEDEDLAFKASLLSPAFPKSPTLFLTVFLNQIDLVRLPGLKPSSIAPPSPCTVFILFYLGLNRSSFASSSQQLFTQLPSNDGAGEGGKMHSRSLHFYIFMFLNHWYCFQSFST